MQANLSDRDNQVVEVRWQAASLSNALLDYEAMYEHMPPGYHELATSHRRSKGKGARRSCTLVIHRYTQNAPRLEAHTVLDHFKVVLDNERKPIG